MSLKCEFLDDERTELCGHGMTDVIDGVAIFENAVVIGTFEEGYIDEVELANGEKITACIGVGEIDSSCYHNFCQKLDENIANGIYPNGSVEILRTAENEGIVYKYGYKDKGRIPTEFIHSGYALLGITPADDSARLVELNEMQKEDIDKMTESEIKALVEQTVSAMVNCTSEINQCKEDCDKRVAELNEVIENLTNEKAEISANSEKIQAALDECKKELEETYKKLDGLYEELDELREALGKAKAKERIGELNAALADYSDEEKAYAQAEIDAFMEKPVESEINSVVDKILIGIGKKAKETSVTNEQNSAKTDIEDIFSGVDASTPAEDKDIFN